MEIVLWIVNVFMMQVEILSWTIVIFMMAGRDFHDDRSKFLFLIYCIVLKLAKWQKCQEPVFL